MESAAVLSLITLVGAICTGFFKLFGDQNKTHDKIGTALDRLAEAHEKGNKESAERNGHLGEQNIQLAELQKESSKQLLEAIANIAEQKVAEQTVVHQHVENKE